MNKKDLSEIRRLFTPERSPINKICGCYIDAEKNIKMTTQHFFQMLPEEEQLKYFKLFRKALSGSIGRSLLELEIPLEQESDPEGSQAFLLELRDNDLNDEETLQTFYQKVIDSYVLTDNYYIILIHCSYDIPRKTRDGAELFDSSEDVYNFLLCCLCPVKLSKPGLSWHEEEQIIGSRVCDWIVDDPANAFLFPAFSDRNTDIHEILYYMKKASDAREDFAASFLGCPLPMTAEVQKESFSSLIEEVLYKDCSFETVQSLQENLADLMEEHKEDPDPVILGKGELRDLLEISGAPKESLEHFEECFSQTPQKDHTEWMAANLTASSKYEIKTPEAVIRLGSEHLGTIRTEMIDGRPYLLIPADGEIELNGIQVKALSQEQLDRISTKAQAPAADSE